MVNLTDTAYYSLCVIRRVNDSTKRFVVQDYLDILRNLHQVSVDVKSEGTEVRSNTMAYSASRWIRLRNGHGMLDGSAS